MIGSRPDPRRPDWRAQAEDPPGTQRLFFAVPLSDDARARVGELMQRVQGSVGDGTSRVRWVRVDGLHLTLRFLGSTPVARIPALREAADAVASSVAPFSVVLHGGGAFPSPARPRSLWIGVEAGGETLARLAQGLADAAVASGGRELDTRPFTPHLTIGRTDGLRSAPAVARALVAAAADVQVDFPVSRLALYRSILGRGPAQYEPVHESALG